MSSTNTFARSLHDVGLATWFGGSLMGDIALNGAASTAATPADRAGIAATGWARWTPVNLVAIGAHLVGGVLVVTANKSRISGQQGVASTSVAKTALTLAALGATGYSRWLGQRLIAKPGAPVDAATTPNDRTPADVADAQRKLRIVQWTIPALTGAMVVLSAWMGEQQRPATVVSGVLDRVIPGRP